ncbi:MAG: MBL fold metallo-hydrolase [Deltaproteobacteria bacterium]|nr:MBL fold metallo-hydrolase [Deltaproteobacteria bacterium]
MKITIIYDNTAFSKSLTPDWGFSCLVEAYGRKILFDTGAKGSILLDNMKKLDISPSEIDMVFISHDHWDHTGGLPAFLKKNQVKVFIPASCKMSGDTIVRVDTGLKICENIYSTGELQNIEHSLVIKERESVIVIAGCSHPGVREIMKAASQVGRVSMLIGGLHGFSDFELINDLEKICPTHCTQYIQKIETLFPDKYIKGGAGKVIEMFSVPVTSQ